ncbi:MAG TPA: hypothetical protein VGO75_03110 [Gemmatimonadaceae bacterium]|jgi:hypothetical protein|nr:hypothetical protein [Gemmatimonadaceae bacterium]
MPSSNTTVLSAKFAVAIGLGVFVLACATLGGSYTSTDRPAPDAIYPLPPGVSSDAEAFRTQIAPFLAETRGMAHTRSRRAECYYIDICHVDVKIQPVGNTVSIDPNVGPAVARPVAHLVNLNTRREKYYKLRDSTQAEYYLWADSTPGSGKTRWTLLEIPKHGKVLAAPPTDLNLCVAHPPAPPPGDADFTLNRHPGGCNYPLPYAAAPAAVSYASLLPTGVVRATLSSIWALLAFAKSEGGWIDCSMGCCT